MRTRLLRGFLLEDVLVEPLQGLITRQDISSHLPPKAMGILLQLALKPGEVVTRQTLLEEIWEGRSDANKSLDLAIADIRAALGDTDGEAGIIRTIAGEGYCLTAAPEFLDAPQTDGHAAPFDELPPLLRELMLRKVVQTAVAYLIVGWVLIQVADTAFDKLGMPWWSASFVTILVVAGFPIALVLSWFIEFAGGKVRLENRVFSGSKTRSGVTYLAVVLAMLVSAAGLSVYRGLTGDDSLFGTPPSLDERPPVTAGFSLPVLPNSVAVLRFLHIGGDNRFSDGLSENLLHLLTRIGELSIPSRTSSWAISNQGLTSFDIAERLHVRYVLEGSVQQVENNIRVTAQLIDGQTGRHIWSENYDRTLDADGFFYILDDIAGEVVESLQTTLSLKSMAVLERDNTTSTEALKLYLLGTQYLREPKTDESLTNAVQSFESAIEADAHFAQAHAGLCEANLARFVMTRDTGHFEKAERPCLRALTLDDTLGEVYAAMGSLHRYAGRYDEAQIELEKARELMPHSSPVLEELGRVYRYQGRMELAERTFSEAIIAEPSSWSAYKSLGNFLYRTGRYEEAVPLYQRVIEIEPEAVVGYNNLGGAYFMLGRFDDASRTWDHIIDGKPSLNTLINYANSLYYQSKFEQSAQVLERALEMSPDDYRTWENLAASLRHVKGAADREARANARVIELAGKALRVNPGDQDALSTIALTYVRSGDRERARQTMAELYGSGWDDPNVPFYMALAHLELGEPEPALAALEQAVEMGFPVNLIVADPDFHALHETARFAALGSRE